MRRAASVGGVRSAYVTRDMRPGVPLGLPLGVPLPLPMTAGAGDAARLATTASAALFASSGAGSAGISSSSAAVSSSSLNSFASFAFLSSNSGSFGLRASLGTYANPVDSSMDAMDPGSRLCG